MGRKRYFSPTSLRSGVFFFFFSYSAHRSWVLINRDLPKALPGCSELFAQGLPAEITCGAPRKRGQQLKDTDLHPPCPFESPSRSHLQLGLLSHTTVSPPAESGGIGCSSTGVAPQVLPMLLQLQHVFWVKDKHRVLSVCQQSDRPQPFRNHLSPIQAMSWRGWDQDAPSTSSVWSVDNLWRRNRRSGWERCLNLQHPESPALACEVTAHHSRRPQTQCNEKKGG